MSTIAHDLIAALKRGEEIRGSLTGVIVNGRADDAALDVFARELAAADADLAEKLVDLLVELGLQTEPLSAKGAEVLRDPRIIAILAGPGLARNDLGQYAAVDALRKLVRQQDLIPHEDAVVLTLLKSPNEESFLLAAKTKPVKERVLVLKLARSPEWKEVEAAKITRAALGAEDIETEFITLMKKAADGEQLAKALDPPALIGTPRSLKAVAAQLRTPLTILHPGVYEKSVRLNVLDALLYNFPDQPVLYPNNIITEEDYTAAEHFCTQTLGVTYTEPPPPFMTIIGFPYFQ